MGGNLVSPISLAEQVERVRSSDWYQYFDLQLDAELNRAREIAELEFLAKPRSESVRKNVLPVMLALQAPNLSLDQKMRRVSLKGSAGRAFIRPDEVVVDPRAPRMPENLCYPLFNVVVTSLDDSDPASLALEASDRRGLTPDEGISLVFLFPEILIDHELILAGARTRESYVPCVYLDQDRPTLGCVVLRRFSRRWVIPSCDLVA